MRRRELIAGIVGATAAWPLGLHAQQRDSVRRVGVLTAFAETDPEGRKRAQAIRHGLQELGWVEGSNIRIDYRWGAADANRIRELAAELVRLAPDVIVTNGTPSTEAVRRQTGAIPIVFANVADPIGAGFAATLARPGGNLTGFANFESSLGGKWLELLREAAPGLGRVLFLLNAGSVASRALSEAISAAASRVGMTMMAEDGQRPADIERAVAAFAREAGGGLIVQPDASIAEHRRLIIALAAQHRLPAMYPFAYYASDGGLMAYAVDTNELIARTARYVDRIFKGAKPSQLPVQLPEKFEFVLNLRTARTLGLQIQPSLLARADEVIE
jgi:putative ABC transport system substrate-binding protein